MERKPTKIAYLIFMNILLVVAFIGIVWGMLDGIAKQERFDQQQISLKCQEGWQSYCRKMVNGKVVVGQ